MEEMWVITNINDNSLFWNNHWGWIEEDDDASVIDLFTKGEKEELQLPLEGKWVAI